MMQVNVHQVAIKKASGFNLMSVKEFMSVAPSERTELILQKKVQFLNETGDVIPLQEAVRSIVRNYG